MPQSNDSRLIRLSLLKRRNGFYYILYHEDGRVRWKSTGCRLKPDALAALARFDELLKSKPPAARLSAFTKDFLAYSRSVHAKKTTEINEYCLRRLGLLVGDILVSNVTAKHADAYKAQRLKSVSPVSVNVELVTLAACFATAIRWGLTQRNPFREIPRCRLPERAPAYFTKEDFERLLAFAPSETFRRLVVIAAHTGLRRGELVNLQWRNVDFARRLLVIETSATFKTKQGKRRLVPMNETCYAILSAMNANIGSPYVFTQSGSANGERMKECYLSHAFKKVVRAAGLPDTLHVHSLRHTFASWLVGAGESLYAVQQLMGHTHSSTTEIYAHLAPSALHSAVEKISVKLN